MSESQTFQSWFNDMLHRRRKWTRAQLKHEALKIKWSEIDAAEAISQWIDRQLLRAMKKVRADGLPMAGWSAVRAGDGSRFVMRPESWLFDDWKYNILLRMKSTKSDVLKASKIYDYGAESAEYGDKAREWPRPYENPQFYWTLRELEDLQP